MKIIPQNSNKRLTGLALLGLIWGAIVISLIIAGRFYERIPIMQDAWQCPTKVFTGRPCATCGTTRMFVFLSQGNILTALETNPFMFLLVVLGIVMGVYAMGAILGLFPRVRIGLGRWEKRFLGIGFGVLLLANWIYLIAAGK